MAGERGAAHRRSDDDPPSTPAPPHREARRRKARPLRSWPVFGLFLGIFSTAWFPVLDTDYGVRDDHIDLVTEALNPPWYAIDHESDRGMTPGMARRRVISEGRPLSALLLDLAWRAVSGIEDLRYFRFVGIVGIALLAWSLYRVLVGVGHGRFPSFCVAAIGCSTLPFQIWAHWAIAMTYPFAAALSGVAVLLAEKASSANDHYRPPLLKWLSAGGAGLVLLAALAIYQAAAMFYWVFAAVVVLDSKGGPRELFRRLRWHCAVAAAGLASSFGLVEWGLTLYPTHADRTALVSSLSGKLEWFLHDAAPYALNFVVPSPSRALLPTAGDAAWFESADRVVAWAVFLIVSGGLVLYFRAGGSAPYRFPVAVFLLAASFLPVLAPEIDYIQYRMLAAPSCLLVVYAYWGVHGLARALRRGSVATVALGAAALFGLAAASRQVRVGLVEPQVRESEFLRRELSTCDLSSVQRIYIIGLLPKTPSVLSGSWSSGSLRRTSDREPWSSSPCSRRRRHTPRYRSGECGGTSR